MWYRNYVWYMKKSEYDKIKNMTIDELRKHKKVKTITNIALYWLFRLQRHVTLTKVQILTWRGFKEKTYKRFTEKWNQKKDEITVSIK